MLPPPRLRPASTTMLDAPITIPAQPGTRPSALVTNAAAEANSTNTPSGRSCTRCPAPSRSIRARASSGEMSVRSTNTVITIDTERRFAMIAAIPAMSAVVANHPDEIGYQRGSARAAVAPGPLRSRPITPLAAPPVGCAPQRSATPPSRAGSTQPLRRIRRPTRPRRAE